MKNRSILKSGVIYLFALLLAGTMTMMAFGDSHVQSKVGLGEGIQRNQSQMMDHECDCDGDCGEEGHEGKMPVKITGAELKTMKIIDVAALWEIDGSSLLNQICTSMNIKGFYTLNSTIDELRLESRFTPSEIKMIADSLKAS